MSDFRRHRKRTVNQYLIILQDKNNVFITFYYPLTLVHTKIKLICFIKARIHNLEFLDG